MANAQKRIAREFADLQANPLEGISIAPIDADMFNWTVTLSGPKNTAYAGGTFTLQLALPTTYPFKPPVLSFRTRIYHPNVTNDEKGSMCLGILRSDTWKPSCRIAQVLEMARGLLVEPNAEDAVENAIAQQYKTDPEAFAKKAKEVTKQYAK